MIIPPVNQSMLARTPSVEMGPEGYFPVLLRLVAMELYKFRRRAMSKALLGVGLGVVILVYLIVGFATWYQVNRPLSAFEPPFCSAHKVEGCVNQTATRSDVQHYKQIQVNKFAHLLYLPGSLNIVVTIVGSVLVVLAMIVVGTMVGGEYSLGTVRLMFIRGPTRLQFLGAKLITGILLIVPAFLLFVGAGILLGAMLTPLSGSTPDFAFLTDVWFGHAVLYLLLAILYWCIYAMIAFFFGTVGRSTVAAIVGPLVWLSTEQVLSQIIHLLVGNATGPLADFAKAVLDDLIATNISSLIANQSHILFNSDPGTVTDLHALLVLAVYLTLFIGLSCWFTIRRDITN